jgi:hypothetical protein
MLNTFLYCLRLLFISVSGILQVLGSKYMAYTKNVAEFCDSLSVPINHEHRDSTVMSHIK